MKPAGGRWLALGWLAGCLLPDVKYEARTSSPDAGVVGVETAAPGATPAPAVPEPRSVGEACVNPLDCSSRVCESGRCAAPSCDDGAVNQDETGADCGGTACRRRCDADASCLMDGDCAAELLCVRGTCVFASCRDGALTSPEILVDCGGGECPGCPPGTRCNAGTDCDSGVCGGDGRCTLASCSDGLQNQGETGADCGGVCGNLCQAGKACRANAECESGVCAGTECAAAPVPTCAGVSFATSCYELFTALTTWDAAEATCIALGGHLASVDSPGEDAFLSERQAELSSPGDGSGMWLGGTDALLEGDFRWADNAPVVFAGWAPAQPNNGAGIDCIEKRNDGTGLWYDELCTELNTYVCERPL